MDDKQYDAWGIVRTLHAMDIERKVKAAEYRWQEQGWSPEEIQFKIKLLREYYEELYSDQENPCNE